ncbi:MAG: glycoside hydrolase N-terminal domain-containing protein [Clostridia bacterium]|nr:glycoside hydrolase N-terminal domain-containing protein [Clostridia bacterium]
MEFNKPIKTWDEGLQLGNGTIGCLVWNDNPLKFSIDRTDLWEATPAPQTLRDDFTYENMVTLMKEGRFDELHPIFDDCYSHITPTKILGGRIELDFGAEVEKISYKLDRRAPIAKVDFEVNGKSVSVESFVFADDCIGMIRINGTKNVNYSVIRPDYGIIGEEAHSSKKPGEITNGNISDMRFPAPYIIDQPNLRGFIQSTGKNFQYALLASCFEIDSGLLIVYTIDKGSDDDNLIILTEKLHKYFNSGFQKVSQQHLAWWKEYYSKSDIRLSDSTLQEIWDVGNYLLACVSRKGSPPMPLQGVFTADCGILPPWKGDYHNDTNTQMSYYSYMKANHLEQGASFVDFLADLMPQFKKFAKEFFDADDAINVPGVMTIDGKPMGGWCQYSLSITTAIWLCRNLEDYYNYTLDKNYFNEVLYPFMVGTERCIMRWLVPTEDGKLKLVLSTTPEWANNSPDSCFFDTNTNYDLMLLHYLYEKLIKYAMELNDPNIEHYMDIKSKLPDYYSDSRGYQLTKDKPLTSSHRHFSHLMGIYPLRTITWDKPAERDLISKSILELERNGMSYWVGFSFPWMSQLYTVSHNGEGAAYMLKLFYESICLPNGFHCNGDYKHHGITVFRYRPVTLEANMAAMDAVQEMLLYGVDGTIRVFPAISKELAEKGAEFKTLRVEGAALVSAKIERNVVEYIKINALKGGTFTIILPNEMIPSSTAGIISNENGKLVYDFRENETLILKHK